MFIIWQGRCEYLNQMVQTTCEILEIGLAGKDRVIRLVCPTAMIPTPGQYMLASGLGTDDILPTALFVTDLDQTSVEFCGEAPASWFPGVKLALRGPFGHGFHVPAQARRIVMVSYAEHFKRLLPLMREVNDRMAGITLFSDHLVEDLPAEVEALPLESVRDAWSWADYVVIETPFDQLANLRNALHLADGMHPSCPAEVLVLTPMPCGGMADCGVCSISSNSHYRLACKEGPVFDLNLII